MPDRFEHDNDNSAGLSSLWANVVILDPVDPARDTSPYAAGAASSKRRARKAPKPSKAPARPAAPAPKVIPFVSADRPAEAPDTPQAQPAAPAQPAPQYAAPEQSSQISGAIAQHDETPKKPSVSKGAREASRRAASRAAGATAQSHAAGAQAPARPEDKPAAKRRELHVSARTWNRIIVIMAAALTFVAVCVILYSPAQQLYKAVRENERLNDELSQNYARNTQMAQRVAVLQTAEGVQDEARRLFGMVLPNEESVTAVGLVGYEEPSNSIPTPIVRGSGQASQTWATELLDIVFGQTETSATIATGTGTPSGATVTEATAEPNPNADIVAQGD